MVLTTMTCSNWIFIRGLTRGNAHWGAFPEILKSKNPEIKIELLEIPGNGTLSEMNTPITSKEVIHFLKNRSQFFKEHLPVNLCGISLGGMIALKWAELFPENIKSVTIINSSLSQYSAIYKRMLPNNYLKIISILLNGKPKEQEKIILSITSNKLNETKKYLPFFVDFYNKHPVSKLNFISQIILANKIKIHNFPNIPLKIISSELDRLVDPSCSDEIAKALGGTQYTHSSAGHDLPLDEPEWLTDTLLNH